MRPSRLLLLASALVATVAAAGLAGASVDSHVDSHVDPGKSAPDAIKYQGGLLLQLAVSDLDRAIVFYRDVMGFKLIERIDELSWAKLDPGVHGVTIGVGESEGVTGSGSTSMNFTVGDIDGARRLLESRGVEFLGPTITIPGVVRLADFHDPDGNKIRLAGAP